MRDLIREPLVHFILAAAVVFAAYSLLRSSQSQSERTIHISAAELERLAALYAVEAGTLPSPADLQAIIVDHVENEALTREARRLGLGEGDTVVERRLAQKMRFMVDDLAVLPDPTEAELRTWFDEHASEFAAPERISFDHVFFASSEPAALPLLQQALNGDTPPDWRRSGDPFMLQRQYGELPMRETVRLFGQDFATAISGLPVDDAWQGPVNSALGTHLVRLTARSPARIPDFEDVRGEVEADYRAQAQRRMNADAVAEIVARYEVEIEGLEP